MRALPNMGVYIPADSIETRFLTNHLCKTSAPGYLRLGKNGEKNLITSYNTLIPNRITEIKRGNDGTILFVGSIGIKALIAAEILEKKGIEISVASVPFVSDIDLEYLKLAAAKGPIITVEEHSRFGGFGSLVLETLNLLCIDFNLRIVAATRNNLSEIGSQEYLRAKNGLDENSIVEAFNSFR
jgi:transketolase